MKLSPSWGIGGFWYQCEFHVIHKVNGPPHSLGQHQHNQTGGEVAHQHHAAIPTRIYIDLLLRSSINHGPIWGIYNYPELPRGRASKLPRYETLLVLH